jgi:hypothetical protein
MTDTSQQVPSEPENPSTPSPTPSIPPQPQKSNKNIWIIAGIAVGIVCLCSIICIAVFGGSMFRIYKEKAPVESVLDAYMTAMVNKDADSAYALFSPRAQRQIPVSKIQELLDGNNFVVFEGYQSLSIGNINISATANTNPDLPQGIVAKVNGIVTYEDDVQGTFNGILEKVGDQWMIDSMFVTVPPSKIK